MRSPEKRLLLGKDARELLASRSFWLLLVLLGPLVGQAFLSAVGLYAEASGAGGMGALPQGLSPLDGIVVPAWGAYDLAVTLLFPFVAIRVLSGEKESGAAKLLLQSPAGLGAQLASKVAVLTAAWGVAFLPGALALVLWTAYGGHLAFAETANLFLGHSLHALVTAGVAFAAAAIAGTAASAAVSTLAFTVGTWALDFVAAGRGGLLQRFASLTPLALLRSFEQGELRLSAVVVSLVLASAGLALAAVWIPPGRTPRARATATAAVAALLALLLFGASGIRAGRDLSEDRRNSFSRADERALLRLPGPIRVSVHLAAEDPRLMDLSRGVLGKLLRLRGDVDVRYEARSRSGLFEGADPTYGEIRWEVGGRAAVSRSTTEPVVLALLYELGGVATTERVDGGAYPGYPLAASPRGAALLFFVLWPAAVLAAALLHRRRRRAAALSPDPKERLMKRILLALLLSLLASPAPPAAAAPPAPIRLDLSAEKAGQPSAVFLSAVGDWVVAEDGGKKVLLVDGREWKRGQPSAGLAETARALYGARHEEFLDKVKAFAYFPITVARGIEDFRGGEISIRFKLLGGQMDQCAGILFDVQPNGDYLAVRYNKKDVNVVLWTFNEGTRKFVKKGPKDVDLPLHEWHALKIAIQGTALTAFLDGQLYLEYTLPRPVSGKVGLWSKTDSIAEFDDVVVTPAAP